MLQKWLHEKTENKRVVLKDVLINIWMRFLPIFIRVIFLTFSSTIVRPWVYMFFAGVEKKCKWIGTKNLCISVLLTICLLFIYREGKQHQCYITNDNKVKEVSSHKRERI